MAVMKPDTFDAENKGVSNQLSLIETAIGPFVYCSTEDTGKTFSINDSETGFMFYLHS